MDSFGTQLLKPRNVNDCPLEAIANTLCKSELKYVHGKSHRQLQRARSKSTDASDSKADLTTLKIIKMVHNNPVHSIKDIGYVSHANSNGHASAYMEHNEEVTEAHLSYNKIKSLKYLQISRN